MADQRKPSYPSKSCPKCGKSIHARAMSHEDCGWKARKVGRPAAVAKSSTPASISLEDIRAVKDLADRIGVDKVRQLAAVLSE